MKKSMINTERIEGRIYQHNLKLKTVQNQNSANFGKEFISGTVDVATDDDALNVIQVHFTYVTGVTKGGSVNPTFKALKKIIDGKTWLADGKDEAVKVKIDANIALNDFYNQEGNLVSTKMNEGGFVTIVSELAPKEERNTFTVDMLITKVTSVEPDEEKNITEPYVIIRGAVFNFRNAILPLEFTVRKADGIEYFEGLGVTGSEPVFTKVWGNINSTTTTITRAADEAAFGEAMVKTYQRKTKEWEVTGSMKIPYEYGEEEVLTASDITKAMQDREVYLAGVKKRADDYRASSQPTVSAFGTVTNNSGFNF
jgi:hypothetical protein